MKFTEYKGLDLPKVAEEILNYWEEQQIFEKVSQAVKVMIPMCFLKAPFR